MNTLFDNAMALRRARMMRSSKIPERLKGAKDPPLAQASSAVAPASSFTVQPRGRRKGKGAADKEDKE